MPRKVLKEEYEGHLEPDEGDLDTHLVEDDDDFDTYDAGNEYIRESAASPPAPKVSSGLKEDNSTKDSADGSKNIASTHKGI